MKFKSSLAFLIVAGAAVAAAPQGIQFGRTYAVGDVDSYHMKMNIEGALALEMNMDVAQKVVKVYDNGDADVEATVSGGKMTMAGNNVPIPATKPTTSRIDKYGGFVSGGAQGRSAMSMDFSKFARKLPKEGLTPGQTINVEEVGTEGDKVKVKGTYKLESVEEGVAKLHSILDISSEKITTPMHMDVTTFIETAGNKLKRMEGKMTNLSGMPGMPPGMQIDSVSITMERK